MATTSSVSEGKHSSQRRKSCDTVCSSNSSCYLNKRKSVNPLANSIRTYVSRSTSNNAVKQRVLSARLLKLRSLQNQLNDANFHLAELQQENRALRNLQSRQDKALSRYEGRNADLPKLIKSHEEDIRVLTTRNKTLRKNLKDVTDQLKVKEDELASVRDQLKSLVALTKNKNLGERQNLAEQIEELKEKLKGSHDQINLLNRKFLLESKNYKYKLNAEISKNKQAQKELSHALNEIDRLTVLLETKGKGLFTNGRKRFTTVNQRASVSLINLSDEKMANKSTNAFNESIEESKESPSRNNQNRSVESDLDNQSDHSDIKLEPIASDSKSSSSSGVMVSPSENIKARLSANSITKYKDIDQISKSVERMILLDSSSSETSLTTNTTTIKQINRPSSSHKLEKLPSTDLDTANKTIPHTEKKEEDIEQRLGEYCNEVLSKVKDCSAVVDKHTQDFESVKSETEKLLQNLRETDVLNSKLRFSNFLSTESFEIPEKDVDLANKIWKDEYTFRKDMKNSKNSTKEHDSFIKSDRNGNVIKKEVDVTLEDKNKLLATLRAIDNGEEIEEMKYGPNSSNKKNTLEELFTDVHK